MRGSRRLPSAPALLGCASVACVACSTILGLEPPPGPEAASGSPDATVTDGAPADGGSPDAATACGALDGASEDADVTYFDLDPGAAVDAGEPSWEFFDTTKINAHIATFSGGAFDGRYVYFAPRGSLVIRFDTQEADGGAFAQASTWSSFDVSSLGIPGGFSGAVFDGRYVYFVPFSAGATPTGSLARYDSTGSFASPSSWTTFDLSALAGDAGAATRGFTGGVFDGRYVYFAPRNDGTPDGRVVRYDTAALRDAATPSPTDAGSGGDADADGGDAGAPSPLANLGLWQTFDVSTAGGAATGFFGGVFDGTSVVLVPSVNDALDGAIHGGSSGVAARLRLDAGGGFASSASWSTFDLTNVSGLAFGFAGGAFDGRFTYFAPRNVGIATRFDTTGAFGAVASWSTYDVTRVVDAGTVGYAGAAFDGRFVYYAPAASGFTVVLRYDTASPFDADCAWSSVDIAQFDPNDAGTTAYSGAVFDGQYLYFVPNGHSAARFRAKSPASMPALPAFFGSFL
jgi:hypothetical protein